MKQMGYVIGGLGMSLLFTLVWLVIAKLIPGLRDRLGLTYGIAGVLAFVPSLVAPRGPNVLNLIGPVICVGLLIWQYRRDRERAREAAAEAERHKGGKRKARR